MNVASKRFTDLRVWQESHFLSLEIYKLTKEFPEEEAYGLSSQLRRAAVSVTSNIAEGFNRFSKKEKIQFYSIALGSVSEVHSQTILAKDLHYISDTDFKTAEEQIEIIHKALAALIKSLRF
jgi:four helix bundle protein